MTSSVGADSEQTAVERPDWFATAVAARPRVERLDVDGVSICARRWGAPELPGLVFVHGGAAHSGWWDHIAPFFAGTHSVAAIDLSGHGDSDHRAEYSLSSWAQEVAAVSAAGTKTGRAVVVGHSMGGWVTIATASRFPERVAAAIVLDSPLRERPPEEAQLQQRRRPPRVYPSLDEAMRHFRTLPEQRVVLPYLRQHVAEQSLRRVPDGWSWKFDASMFAAVVREDVHDLLPTLRCPIGLVRCEHGLLTTEMATRIQKLLDPTAAPSAVVELPEAGHHPMLDQPLPLVAALRALLAADAGWAAR